jgi:glucans biosynthesis protein
LSFRSSAVRFLSFGVAFARQTPRSLGLNVARIEDLADRYGRHNRDTVATYHCWRAALGDRLANLRAARRCGARNRAGSPCECPALRGRSRCRLHGGKSTGAPRGNQNGNYLHGYYTADAIKERQWARSLLGTFAKDKPNG